MFIGDKHLADLAERATMHSEITFGSTTECFPPEGDVTEPLRTHIAISADLASATTRLASVEHVLKQMGERARHVHAGCRDYFNGNSPQIPNLGDRAEWFHIMLRDVVAHAEPDRGATDEGRTPQEKTRRRERKRRYEARAEFIKETTLGWAYARLRQTADELKEVLKTSFEISVPS